MKKYGKLIALVLVLVLAATALSACAQKAAETPAASEAPAAAPAAPAKVGTDIYGTKGTAPEVKIAYIPLSTAGVTNSMVQKACEEQLIFYPNISVVQFDPMYDPNQQISMINDCVTQGYKGILLEAADTEALNNTIADAEKAGVPVITINVGASGLHTLHVQGNDYSSGAQAAQVLAAAVGDSGNAIVLDCPAEQKPISLMGTGFEDEIKKNHPNITLLESFPIAMWSPENANTTMRDALTKYDKIDLIYCASDDIAHGAILAIEAAGRSDEIKVYGSMGYPDTLQAIKDGTMFGTYFSDGYLEYSTALYFMLHAIETGTTSITDGYTDTPLIDMPTVPTTSANVNNVISDSRWESLGLYQFK